MTFSELDFARLGLATQTSNSFNAHTQGCFLAPLRQSRYPDPEECSITNASLFTGQLPNLNDSTSNAAISSLFQGSALNHQQPTSFPSQTDLNQLDTEPGLRLENLALNPSLHSGSPPGSLQYNPIAENQQPGLPRRRSRYLRRQTRTSSTEPINIPRSSTATDESLDPMQRWQDSPPEAEAASLSAIVNALQKTPLRTRSSASSLTNQRVGSRAPSTVSFGSGTSCSSASIASANSPTFRTSSRGSRGRVTKRTRTPGANAKDTDKRVFPCTFCCDSFKSKYDWARHEKSLHLNLQGWRCTPFGGTIVSPDTGRSHCAYCSQLDPTPDHLDSHNHGSCQNEAQPHTFSRKDHLVQHLRLVHHVQTLPIIDCWKFEGPQVTSRCGICSIRLQTWQERVDHLAKHFRKGATMDDWKGEHCFEPSIAAQVNHAIPPYLIASETRAPLPFSATNPDTKDHLSQIRRATEQSSSMWDDGHVSVPAGGSEPSPESQTLDPVNERASSITFPEVLALHLGRYARGQMRLGVMPTDAMFQEEARRIVFESEDPWDQTIADNDDWLSCFRSHHLGDASGSREHST
ncbi:hypothetical protein FDECE_425 [Fusarium decemcellulare]|nr:hypothetical protein FDECE_425 [Fusarium decemcellulare]